MVYQRTAEQRAGDFARAAEFENEVGTHLSPFVVAETTATDRLDFWMPGYFLDVKEKRQKLTALWTGPSGLDEENAFIIDELSVRRAARHWPSAYFFIKDVPLGRFFIASVVEMVCIERYRLQRGGKGKWVIDLRDLHEVQGPEVIEEYIYADQVAMPWKRSGALGAREVPQV